MNNKVIIKLPVTEKARKINRFLKKYDIPTICRSAGCPNRGICWNNGEVTFLLLGNTCTRNCRFCKVEENLYPESNTINTNEPYIISSAITELDLEYIVLTSVTRDDLPDHGFGYLKDTVQYLQKNNPKCLIEVLAPDFQGNELYIKQLCELKNISVISHNIEMVKELYPRVRPECHYETSINILKHMVSYFKGPVKTSFMLGLGENPDQITNLLNDLKKIDISILYIGQYYMPSKDHYPVKKIYTKEEIKFIEKLAIEMGFSCVLAGQSVRSSFQARETFLHFQSKLGVKN